MDKGQKSGPTVLRDPPGQNLLTGQIMSLVGQDQEEVEREVLGCGGAVGGNSVNEKMQGTVQPQTQQEILEEVMKGLWPGTLQVGM